MEFTMERWYSAVGQRFAVRKYAGAPGSEELQALEQVAKTLTGKGVRIALCQNDRIFSPIFLGYGKVKGTNCFGAMIRKEDSPAYLQGYLGEAFALECTALGLGTCWLANYNKKAAQAVVPLEEGEALGCIIAVGQPGEAYAARPRKTLDRLTGLSQEALQDLPEWQQRALECARMAPSAVNGQPWRFLPEEDAIRVVNTSNNYGHGKLDCGIAMLHIELGAAHCGVAGDWRFEGEDAVFVPVTYGN